PPPAPSPLSLHDALPISPLELLDEVESQLSLIPTPVTWPVGSAESFVGLVDRRAGSFIRFARVARGAGEAGEEVLDLDAVAEHRSEEHTSELQSRENLVC